MKTHILRALSEKSFFNLWIGEVFTQVSVNLFNFFLILVVFKQTHSNTAVSGAVISFTIPAILFGSIAGVLVDRWSKRKVLIVTNIVRAFLFILLAFYLNNLFVIYLISFVVAILTQFFIPAESPIIPLVVRSNNLLSANALFGMGIFGSVLIAYVMSGPLILLVGQFNALLVLAVLLFIGALFIYFVKLTYEKKEKAPNALENKLNIIRDIKHTILLIFHKKEISYALLLIALSQIIILVLATIAPGYANQVLGINVEEFPLLIVAPAALGMVVGAVMVVNLFHNHPKRRVITIGIVLSGLAMLSLPFGSKVTSRDFVQVINGYLPHFFEITILHIMAVVAFVLGVANSLVFVPANTAIQEMVDGKFRGKIYGVLNTISGAVSILPILLVGGLSDLIGVANVIIGIGICILLLGFVRIFLK
ncbi:MFS transporter [Candidatus Roizmanbacteria bacterium]|nr:MFS transporter [Candidatus Roizmanbacteria bacterium]